MGGIASVPASVVLAMTESGGVGTGTRRPKDMTEAELEALPIGPFIQHERPLTKEDWDKGMRGRTVVTVEYPQMKISAWVSGDDIMLWRDAEGQAWMFGQWADGTWFKERSFL